MQLLKEKNVTAGCGGGIFCPNDTVNRAQMAVFLGVAYHNQPFTPPAAVGIFSDVTYAGSPWAPYAPWIEELFNDGVTGGCGSGLFCPGSPVSSWQMMVFLAAARHPIGASPLWASYNPVPRGSVFTMRDEGRRIMWEGDATTSGSTAGTLLVRRDNVYLGNMLAGTHVWSGESPTGWYYFGSDHLGSPRFTMFPDGTWQEKRYWPYGEEFSGTGSGQRIRFAGMELDLEGTSTRYYVHARHFELGMARFLTTDPIYGRFEEPQSWNRYAYVLGNPLKYTDRFGLTNDQGGTSAGCTVILGVMYCTDTASASADNFLVPAPLWGLVFGWQDAGWWGGGIGARWRSIDRISEQRIQTLDPRLRQPCRDLIEMTDQLLGVQLRVTDAYRSVADQNEIFKKGREGRPGPQFSNAPGGRSFHNFGRAFDVVPMGAGQPQYRAPNDLWERIGQIGESLGLEWGGRWKSISDKPHFQLSDQSLAQTRCQAQ